MLVVDAVVPRANIAPQPIGCRDCDRLTNHAARQDRGDHGIVVAAAFKEKEVGLVAVGIYPQLTAEHVDRILIRRLP